MRDIIKDTNNAVDNYYHELITNLNRVNNYVLKTPFLGTIIKEKYFKTVKDQITAMKANEISGPINPLYNLVFMLDVRHSFEKSKMLEQSIKNIFNHRITKGQKNDIIGKLNSSDRNQCLDQLFEIAVISHNINHFKNCAPVPFDRTLGKKNVEISLMLAKRKVFIEATVLHDSDDDKQYWDDLINKKIHISVGAIDLSYHRKRLITKIESKNNQFIPSNANVLFLSIFGFQPDDASFDNVFQEHKFNNIGLIIMFKRFKFVKVISSGCDTSCTLSKEEQTRLVAGLKSFPELIYS